jgi:hypothetical protein
MLLEPILKVTKYKLVQASHLICNPTRYTYNKGPIITLISWMNHPQNVKLKKDARGKCIVFLSACQRSVGRRILMKNRTKQYGIKS